MSKRKALFSAMITACVFVFDFWSAKADLSLSWTKAIGPWSDDFAGSFGAIAVHSGNPNTIYVGSSVLEPGVFKSADGGSTWSAKNSGIQQLGLFTRNYPPISKIVISASNPNVIYLGTAVDNPLLAGGAGSIYKSSDGGESWQRINGQRNLLGVYQIQGAILDMDVNPQNPETVYAGVGGQGLFKTSNGGNDWSKVYAAAATIGAVDYFHVVRVLPTQPETVFFSGFTYYSEDVIPLPRFNTTGTQGMVPLSLRKSTDGGVTWRFVGPSSFGMLSDLMFENASGNLYLCTIAYQTPMFFHIGNRGVFRSSDTGEHWETINETTFGNLAQFPFVALLANPSSVNRGIFASGGFYSQLIGSTDEGSHWNRLNGLPDQVYIGPAALAGNRIFVLTSGGIFSADASSLMTTPPTISSVNPRTLQGVPLSQRQRLTIIGSAFTSSTKLVFNDGVQSHNSDPERLTYISPKELKYDIAVGPAAATWTVKVTNGTSESAPFSFIVTTGMDTTAPSPPVNIRSFPAQWARDNLFWVAWENPSDPSGIARVWFKRGSPPISPTDGSPFPLPAFNPLPVSLGLSEGSQQIYLWLEDGAGNLSRDGLAALVLGLDVTPPYLAINAPAVARVYETMQNSIVLQGNYADALSGVASVTWLNDAGVSGTSTMNGGASAGTWVTPSIALGSGVNNIIVTATDFAANVTRRAVSVTYLDTSNSGTVTITITPQGSINTGAKWRVNGGFWRESGYSELNVPTGPRFVDFLAIPGGWRTPAGFFVTVTAGHTSTGAANYTPVFVNAPPNTPSNPSPANGANNLSRVNPSFSWTGGDPDGLVQYAFFLSTSSIPDMHNSLEFVSYGGISGSTVQITRTLLPGTKYYWKANALDDVTGVVVESPIWQFTTEYSYADLIPVNLSLDGNVLPGGPVTLSVTVKNQGTFPSPVSYVNFYLSQHPGAREIRLNPNFSMTINPPLAPAEERTFTCLAVLNHLEAGQSFIDAWIDSTIAGPNAESSFDNNTRSLEISYVDGKDPQVTYCALKNTLVSTGRTSTIEYIASDDTGIKSLDFYYSTDDGLTWTPIQEGCIPPTPPTYGSAYGWTVPNGLPVGGNLNIRVAARDNSGNWSKRDAGPYLIKDGTVPTITVLSPNGGEVWDMGSQHQIQWTLSSANPIQEIRIYFDYGTTTDFVTTVSSPTSTSYLWTLQNNFSTTTGKIRLHVLDANGNEAQDWSDGFFTVRDNSIGPPLPWGTPMQVTSAASSDPGGISKVAAAPDGTLHLLYGLAHDNQTHRISFRYRKRLGGNWMPSSAFSLDVSALDSPYVEGYGIDNWGLAVGAGGKLYLVWATSCNYGSEENKQDVYFTSFDGTSWASPMNLSETIKGDFNVNSLSWAVRASLPSSQSIGASAVANGKLYVFTSGTATFAYDTGANQWTQKANSPSGALGQGGGAEIDGLIYAIGDNSSRVKIYSPANDSWNLGASLPTPRTGVCVAAVGGKMYVIGGINSAQNERYDPIANTWTVKASMPTPRGYAAAAVVNDKIYVMGGSGGGLLLDVVEVYDPVNDSWVTAQKPIAANWPARHGAAATVLNGRVYLFGGRVNNDYPKTVHEYDPASNSSQIMNSMASPHAFAAAGIIGVELFVIGGYDGTSYSSSTERASVTAALVGASSRSPKLGLDSQGCLHFVWEDGVLRKGDGNSITGFSQQGENNLYYPTRSTSGEWSPPQQLTTGGSFWPAMTIGGNGDVHLVCVSYPGGSPSFTYMRKAGDSWSTPSVVASPVNDSLEIACGTGTSLHVAWRYWNLSTGKTEVRYSHFDGQNWSAHELVHGAGQARNPSIIADNLDRPHVVWENAEWPFKLWHSVRIGGAWLNPIQVHSDSRGPIGNSGDAAFTLQDNRLHAVWRSSVDSFEEVFYNCADVSFSTDIFPPLVQITAPTSGGTRSIGSTVTIQWLANDNVGITTVDLDYSTDGGSNWAPILLGSSNVGTFNWALPNIATEAFQFRLIAHDGAGNSAAGYSGSFSVADLDPPFLVISAPSPGDCLTGNSTVNIDWVATDNVGVTGIDLEYSLNDGTSWNEIAIATANTGRYAWSVPNIATSTLLVRATVRDLAGFATTAQSAGPLTIAHQNTPPITPHSPFPMPVDVAVPPGISVLRWSSGDLDGDPLTYEIRFGTSPNPPIVASGLTCSSVSMSSLVAFAALSADSQHPAGKLLPQTTYYWQITAFDGTVSAPGAEWSFHTSASSILGRHIFYNNSAWDGNNPAANANDDNAIAPDKYALQPGQTANFNNYTSYSRGINGLMVDITALGSAPAVGDFIFKVGNNNDPATWADAPVPTLSVRTGVGIDESDRITIIWADNAIQKKWLQVTVKATDKTGLATDDLFYYGNAIGETGTSADSAVVNILDESVTRANVRTSGNPVLVDFP